MSAEVGDSVSLILPDRRYRAKRPAGVTVVGTITGVDTGSRPGVEIELVREVNGLRTCYATHDEITVLRRASDAALADEEWRTAMTLLNVETEYDR